MDDNAFVTWKVRSNPTLGEYLRDARKSRLLSIKAIAEKINVSRVYLSRLEHGHFDKLPGDVYVKGFIKSYASYMKLNVPFALKLYQREKDIYKNVVKEHNARHHVPRIRNPLFLLTPRMFTIGGICLVVFASLFYLWRQFAGLAAPPSLKVFEPADNIVTKTSSLTVNGKTDPEASVLINGQVIFVDTSGNFNESVSLQGGMNTISVVARNKLGKEASVTKEVMVNAPSDLSAVDQKAIAQALSDQPAHDSVDLEVKIDTKATWVYVETDGKFEYSGTMLPGSSQRFTGKDTISLTTGDASQTRVVFNGIAVDNLSDQKGPLRDLQFTKDMNIKQAGKIVRKL